MTQTELAQVLGLTKSTVSILCKRGMPTASLAAANRWREVHAPPRKPMPQNARAKAGEARTAKPLRKLSDMATSGTDAIRADDDEAAISAGILESVRCARKAERWAMERLVEASGRPKITHEAFRRVNSCYIATRQNRSAAERDWREWRRVESETLLATEARDIASRPALAAAPLLAAMPAELAPVLHGANAKKIEKTLAEWCDRVADAIRQAI